MACNYTHCQLILLKGFLKFVRSVSMVINFYILQSYNLTLGNLFQEYNLKEIKARMPRSFPYHIVDVGNKPNTQ